MNYLIAVDDTDMPGTKGTGWIVQEMCKKIRDKQLGINSSISRHQLFVHEDVPYTSHNSSMCFALKLSTGVEISSVQNFIIEFLEMRAEKGSDPGLCILAPDNIAAHPALIDFGRKAKEQVLNKEMAYDLARKQGVYLSEHGGTGDGIIGALAGVGLHLSGNDGRYRGWFHLGLPGSSLTAEEILTKLPFIDAIVNCNGTATPLEEKLLISSEKIKSVRQNGKQVLLVCDNELFPEKSAIAQRLINSSEAKAY